MDLRTHAVSWLSLRHGLGGHPPGGLPLCNSDLLPGNVGGPCRWQHCPAAVSEPPAGPAPPPGRCFPGPPHGAAGGPLITSQRLHTELPWHVGNNEVTFSTTTPAHIHLLRTSEPRQKPHKEGPRWSLAIFQGREMPLWKGEGLASARGAADVGTRVLSLLFPFFILVIFIFPKLFSHFAVGVLFCP